MSSQSVAAYVQNRERIHAHLHAENIRLGVDANSPRHMHAHSDNLSISAQSFNSGSLSQSPPEGEATITVPTKRYAQRSRSPIRGSHTLCEASRDQRLGAISDHLGTARQSIGQPHAVIAVGTISNANNSEHAPQPLLSHMLDPSASPADSLVNNCTTTLCQQNVAQQEPAQGVVDSRTTHCAAPAAEQLDCDGLQERPPFLEGCNLSSFCTFATRPPFAGGYEVSQTTDIPTQSDIPSYDAASKRMRADITALAHHGTTLGIHSDTNRVAHAYQHHLEQFYSELHDSSGDCNSHALVASASCSSAHTHLQQQLSSPTACTSVQLNTATPSGISCGPGPAYDLNRFSGVDPNGCDALVGRPAKLTRHR